MQATPYSFLIFTTKKFIVHPQLAIFTKSQQSSSTIPKTSSLNWQLNANS